MKRILLLALLSTPSLGAETWPTWITRYEDKILAFEAQPFPAPNGAVFAGNSNFTLWGTMLADLSPIPVIKRGFGGSTTVELRYYMDRMMLPYGAKTFVICEGENDFGRGYNEQGITEEHKKVITKIRAHRADSDIVIIALKPSPLRWYQWNRFQATNNLLKTYCDSLNRCLYIDTHQVLLKNGAPDPLLFRDDQLHMNAAGYVKWTGVIKPAIQAFMTQKKPMPPTNVRVDP